MRPTFTARRLVQISGAYEAVLAGGFATAEFEGQPEPETLQCRNELDRTNWLALIVKCDAAIRAGFGDATTILRTSSNRNYEVTFSDALDRMFVLLSQAEAAQSNWWRLKDEARAARSDDELRDIDLTQGWP